MEEVQGTLEVAKGISDYGMMAVTAAFFLVISAVMMIFFFKLFKRVLNNIMDKQNTVLSQLLDENIKQNVSLASIREGSEEVSQMRIKTITSFAFDLSVEKVCRIVKKIRQENNIDDKEATKEKIRLLLKNLHDDRNSKLDNFTYSGKPLSAYTEDKWIESVARVVEREIYAEKANNGRLYSNLDLAYKSIRLQFYKNLRRM